MKFVIPSLVLGIITTLGDHHGSVAAAGATVTMSTGENGKVSGSGGVDGQCNMCTKPPNSKIEGSSGTAEFVPGFACSASHPLALIIYTHNNFLLISNSSLLVQPLASACCCFLAVCRLCCYCCSYSEEDRYYISPVTKPAELCIMLIDLFKSCLLSTHYTCNTILDL